MNGNKYCNESETIFIASVPFFTCDSKPEYSSPNAPKAHNEGIINAIVSATNNIPAAIPIAALIPPLIIVPKPTSAFSKTYAIAVTGISNAITVGAINCNPSIPARIDFSFALKCLPVSANVHIGAFNNAIASVINIIPAAIATAALAYFLASLANDSLREIFFPVETSPLIPPVDLLSFPPPILVLASSALSPTSFHLPATSFNLPPTVLRMSIVDFAPPNKW